MRKYFLIILIVVISVFVFAGCDNENSTTGTPKGTNVKNQNAENKKVTEEYEASVYYDGDHYVLNIFTNLIEREIKISYNTSDFLFDNVGNGFDQDNSFVDDENLRTYTISLDSNTLYKFNFIKTADKDLVIGDTLIIE